MPRGSSAAGRRAPPTRPSSRPTTRAGRRLQLRIEPAGEGMIRVSAAVTGRAARRCDRDRDRLPGARRRALPRLRRALERGRPARQHGRELRPRRPLPARGAPVPLARLRAGLGHGPGATTRPTSRCRGCSRPPATASWSRTPSAASSGSGATTPAAWSVEAEATEHRLPGLRRPDARPTSCGG